MLSNKATLTYCLNVAERHGIHNSSLLRIVFIIFANETNIDTSFCRYKS